MNSINLKRAINYSTILYFTKYSAKVFRSIPDVYGLIESEDLKGFSSKVGAFFAVSSENVLKIWNNCSKLFRDFDEEREDYHIIYINDQLYPGLLKKTQQPPPFLFCQGELELFSKRGIAVVGTRRPSELGIRRAQKLAMLLSAKDYVVVSGLATGIDTAAHTGAIKAGGKTIAVIGTPLDKCYPKENIALQEIIAKGHLLVSQFPFGYRITRFNFPVRNYTMSGISYATVVIEAGETSGALIQARQCMVQGRHLFILKNLLERTDLKWPKRYVDNGAFVIESIEDVPSALKKLPNYKIDSNGSKIQSSFQQK